MDCVQDRALGLEGRWGKYFSCRSVRKDGEEGSRGGGWVGRGKWIGGRAEESS
jgi:hypothetical protein